MDEREEDIEDPGLLLIVQCDLPLRASAHPIRYLEGEEYRFIKAFWWRIGKAAIRFKIEQPNRRTSKDCKSERIAIWV